MKVSQHGQQASDGGHGQPGSQRGDVALEQRPQIGLAPLEAGGLRPREEAAGEATPRTQRRVKGVPLVATSAARKGVRSRNPARPARLSEAPCTRAGAALPRSRFCAPSLWLVEQGSQQREQGRLPLDLVDDDESRHALQGAQVLLGCKPEPRELRRPLQVEDTALPAPGRAKGPGESRLAALARPQDDHRGREGGASLPGVGRSRAEGSLASL